MSNNDNYYDEYDSYGYSPSVYSQPFVTSHRQPTYNPSYQLDQPLSAPPHYPENTYNQPYNRRPIAPPQSSIAAQPQQSEWYSLGDLAQIAKPHEATPVAFDRRLVLTTRLSFLVSLLAIFAYLGVASSKLSLAQGGFFLLGGDWLQTGLDTIQNNLLWLVGANVLYLLLTSAIMLATRNFKVGRPSLHLAIFGQTLLGGLNILLFSLTLAIVVVNVVLWLIIAAICLSVLLGLFRSARS